MMMEQALNSAKIDHYLIKPRLKRSARSLASGRVEKLRQRINDEKYLNAAIQRLALVMSNELMEINKEGGRYERKKRK